MNFYYGTCKNANHSCLFWIQAYPEHNDLIGNKKSSYTLCSEKLTIHERAPLSVHGLERKPFCNLAALTIKGCTELSGKNGALINILTALKNLIHLEISYTQFDKPNIEAEHSKLKHLILKNCNFKTVTYITIPELLTLKLDPCLAPTHDRDKINVSPACFISYC